MTLFPSGILLVDISRECNLTVGNLEESTLGADVVFYVSARDRGWHLVVVNGNRVASGLSVGIGLSHLSGNEGIETLAQAGMIRGGGYLTGSIVWADSDESALSRPLPNVYQVFGHTQQFDGSPIITDHYACLDCRSCFSLDSTGTFTQLQK